MADQRDATTWVAVELTPQGELRMEDGTLEASLRRDLSVDDDHAIFVPCALYRKDGRVVTIHLMEGYVFVASGLPETVYFSLERQPYVYKVLSTQAGPHKIRVLSVIINAHIQEMRAKLQKLISSEIPLGADVVVTDGTYRHLTGKVTGLDESNAFVHIKLRSLEVVATVPRIFLEENQSR